MVKILTSTSACSYFEALEKLENELNTYLPQGWKIYGSLTMTYDKRNTIYVVSYTIIDS